MADKINSKNVNAIIALVLKCKKCGYVWMPTTPKIPNYCPNCKRSDWYK